MIEEYKLVKLIQNYEYYLNRLNSLTGGSIDVRETENKKYIYQHIKEDGKYITSLGDLLKKFILCSCSL